MYLVMRLLNLKFQSLFNPFVIVYNNELNLIKKLSNDNHLVKDHASFHYIYLMPLKNFLVSSILYIQYYSYLIIIIFTLQFFFIFLIFLILWFLHQFFESHLRNFIFPIFLEDLILFPNFLLPHYILQFLSWIFLILFFLLIYFQVTLIIHY